MSNRAHHSDPARTLLEQAIAQHQAILAAALDPIVTIDANGTIQSASDSIERIFGWKPDEIVGRNVAMLMPEPHRASHDGYLATYRRTHQTNILGRTREFRAQRRDGTTFPIELSVSRVDLPGAAQPWFVGIIHDISERKAAEEELQRHRAHLEDMVKARTEELQQSHAKLRHADRLVSIGTLAAGLGHDMNNVLLPIRARLDALDATDRSAHAREQLQAMRRSVAYLQQLSDGLHLLALDPDDAEASVGRTNIAEWWGQVGPLLTKAVPKRVTVQVDLPSNLPEVALPPHRLTQAVLNLVVNAGEAIVGEGTIRIWAQAADTPRSVQVGVTDDGAGMTAEVKKHALDPFFTTKKRGLGTGLGLSLVHGVARSAGGSVDIESEPGKGTTVTLTLPALSQDAPEQCALVSVRDQRAASAISALLHAARVPVRISCNGHDAGSCQLWIIEPDVVDVRAARDYLRKDRRHRIIVFGHPPDEWKTLAVAAVDNPADLDAIRRALGAALTAP